MLLDGHRDQIGPRAAGVMRCVDSLITQGGRDDLLVNSELVRELASEYCTNIIIIGRVNIVRSPRWR